MGAISFYSRLRLRIQPAAEAVPARTEQPVRTATPIARQESHLPVKAQPAPVDALPATARAKAAERLAFVRLVELTQQRRQCGAGEASNYVAVNHAHEFPILRADGQKGRSALHHNNFRNWRSRIKPYKGSEQQLSILADGYRRGIQPKRGDERFWSFFYGCYLNLNKLPLTVAYKMAAAKLREMDKTVIIPTPQQVRYQVDRIPADKLILAREGEVAYKNKCGDFIRRDWTDVAPGECVVGDTRPFDTRVRVWDFVKERWTAVRPNIAGLLDARSWYLPAYWITTEPVNHMTLTDTLALYIRNAGNQAPAVCYFDNGKDYCAQGFAKPFVTSDGAEHSIFRELNIRLLNSLAYNARAKTIERAFRDMMQQFDKVFPDYLGSNPGERTPASAYFDQHPEELPSLEQFCEIFRRWLESYHTTPKRGFLHQGESPAEIWARRPMRPVLSSERLELAFHKPAGVRKVTRGPSVSYDKEWYYCDALPYGEPVLVKTDHRDKDHILCYKLDGTLIGRAETRARIKALALDDAAAQEMIRGQMARQRHQLKEARTYIRDLTGGMHLYSPLELFYAPPGAIGTTAGRVRSVKGAEHHYERHALPVPELAPAAGPSAPPERPEIEFREDKDAESMAQAHAMITRQYADNPADAEVRPEELSDVHKFITQKRRNDDDDY